MKYCSFFFIVILFIISCNAPDQQKPRSGEELAKIYCASCHLFPAPSLLDKKTWKDNVLPTMAKQLGIDNIYEIALPNQHPAVTEKEWRDILAYYISDAPEAMPSLERPPVKEFTQLFSTKKIALEKETFPATSFIKIDEGNHWIYAANAFDSSVAVYNDHLKLLSNNKVRGTVVDMDFTDPLSQPGERDGVLTRIGVMNPNDRHTGSADSFSIDAKGRFTYFDKKLDTLPRPVQITQYDLDGDGKNDYLVCGFGNTRGALFWMKANIGGSFEKKDLSALPGAIKCYINDFNNDGLPDIIVLMAQAQEGIFLYLNKGHGEFDVKKLLGFPPVYGSSYFELVDFNKDGYKDLLYTCGDNGDYSSRALKNYHGIYIYLNDGKNNFTQKYFFPMYGCYKAVARDFDKDGDLDIAAISFFPDTKNRPQESFIYLEQTDAFQFKPFATPAFGEGRWMTMDAGDLDGDGYEDIVLGSLVPPIASKIMEWKMGNGQKSAILFLHNDGKSLLKNKPVK